MRKRHLLLMSAVVVVSLFFTGCSGEPAATTGTEQQTSFMESEVVSENDSENNILSNNHLITDNLVSDIASHSAFEDFGRYLLPWDGESRNYDIPITEVASLMPYHSDIQPQEVVDAVNYMIDETEAGHTIFHDFYTEEEKEEEPSKENAGLFFLRGEPDAPFVLLIPGGGFQYVGSLHEGFPLAVKIAEKGYNAFVLKYRPNRTDIVEDTAAALHYISENAKTLEVSIDDYSMWGLSAGGEAVYQISTTPVEYKGVAVPKPNTAVFVYAWQRVFTEDDPAVFSVIGENDRIGNVGLLKENVDDSRAAGADVELRIYPDTGHGFGIGTGTNAEGWLDEAIEFWEDHMQSTDE